MGGGRKLISLWLCSLALAACTDTLDEAAVPKPLSVAVNARDITARAPIHGTALPDASNIGISLVAEDGTPYDGVTYANLKYTATGTAPDQSWSTPNVPTLSSNTAKLVAYYPWAENTDYSAVPVETDTQTDYMYSQWLTGLSNANPNANIVMKHALTAVRVALVKGDFTADVDVSSVSVKSPAFATAGVMDATTGALSALTGSGDAVTVTADFPLTAQATNVEVMAVPDVSVSSGVTTVTTQIGDRKYSVNINFTESYKQGYIYTYTLTLNNTGMEVTSVAVTPWEEGTTDNGTLEVGYNENEYVVNILSETDNFTYSHNMVDFTGTIDWGDGTQTTYDSKTSYPSHTYATAGTYTVRAVGNMSGLNTCISEEWYPENIGLWVEWKASPVITDILHIGGDMGITDMTGAFKGQKKITTLKEGLFDGLDEVVSFDYVFAASIFYDEEVMNLTSIPADLFNNCTSAETFTMAFYSNHSIKNIPEKLFADCTNAVSFNETFSGCKFLESLPGGLFDNCPEVTSFHGTFMGTAALKEIPGELFANNTKVTDFGRVFGCSGLINIPEDLFKNNTEAINFEIAFSKNYDLQAIPQNLFKYNTKAKCFDATFALGTSITEIPAGLFDNCPEVTDFRNVFDGCGNITEIPAGLFQYNTKAIYFSGAFARTGILEIPEELFRYNTEVEEFGYVFKDCAELTTIPEGLFQYNTKVTTFDRTFWNCTNLKSIPVNLFKNNINVESIYATFRGCTGLTNIPEGLFYYNTKTTSFWGAFRECSGLTNIPEGLFDNCPEVTTFSYTFEKCTALESIPAGLFDNNTKVTGLYGTFSDCTALESESPYTTIKVDGNDVKVHLYERANYPEHFTAPTSYKKCFMGDTGLTDYTNIPAAWK